MNDTVLINGFGGNCEIESRERLIILIMGIVVNTELS